MIDEPPPMAAAAAEPLPEGGSTPIRAARLSRSRSQSSRVKPSLREATRPVSSIRL